MSPSSGKGEASAQNFDDIPGSQRGCFAPTGIPARISASGRFAPTGIAARISASGDLPRLRTGEASAHDLDGIPERPARMLRPDEDRDEDPSERMLPSRLRTGEASAQNFDDIPERPARMLRPDKDLSERTLRPNGGSRRRSPPATYGRSIRPKFRWYPGATDADASPRRRIETEISPGYVRAKHPPIISMVS